MYAVIYQPKIKVESSTEEGLVNCSPREAQPCCNFVLFMMNTLPQGFIITKQQLRKESETSQSSFRFLLEDKENQSISIKQFLYDWAPPAYDYPCLWLNTAQFSVADIPPPRPVIIGNRVLWIGKNYRGQDAATIDLERTRIEITFDKINLRDEELIKLIQGFKPCDEMLRKEILKTPFADLSYYARHKKKSSEVPLSYWKHKRHDDCNGSALSLNEEVSHKWLPPHVKSVLSDLGYYLAFLE